MSRGIRIGVAFVLVVAVVFMLTGCQAIVENATKGAIENATGVKVDNNGDSATITGSDGTVTTVGGTELPEGLPSDFSVYEGKILTSGKTTGADGTSFSFSMETPDAAQTVSDWYKNELESAGWTVESTFQEIAAGTSTGMLTAKKGTSEANITVGENGGKTTIINVLTIK
jgi:hypothetical protein